MVHPNMNYGKVLNLIKYHLNNICYCCCCCYGEGIRASSAAPYYFDDFIIGNNRFQDGAVTANNPTMVAIQESRLLWPHHPIDCIISIGVGNVPVAHRERSTSTLIENGNVLIESASNVDRVDEAVSTFLTMIPNMKYYRFNVIDMRCDIPIDSLDNNLLEKLSDATHDYIKEHSDIIDEAVDILRSMQQHSNINLGSIEQKKHLIAIESIDNNNTFDYNDFKNMIYHLNIYHGFINLNHINELNHVNDLNLKDIHKNHSNPYLSNKFYNTLNK